MTAKRNQIDPWHRVSGNLEPIAAFLTKQDGTPVDLTSGQTVVFRSVRIADGSVKVNDAAASIVDTPTAKVSYQPSGNDTTITVTDPSTGQLLTRDTFAMYFKVKKAGQPDILLPYDGARWLLILQAESAKE